MIKNQWYIILESKEVKLNKPIGVTRLGEKLVLWRDNSGHLNCIADKCIHRGASLCKGHVVNGNIQCPFHGFQFNSNGKCTLIPGNGKNSTIPPQFISKSYKVKDESGFIWLFYGDSNLATDDVLYFSNIDNSFSYKTVTDHWPVHYSRVIENQLDVVHVPFVHKTTIGRGNKTLINGPKSSLENNTLTVEVFNSLDEGNRPLTSDDLKDKTREQKLIFNFPNVWQNYITKNIRVVIAFVPIDDENTKLYLRYYQNCVTLPIIKNIFNALGSMANIVIENQDKRVVKTQLPKKSKLSMGEKLIPGDFPIIQYRKRREELQNMP